mmetsp:Transcript_18995/g.42281  ORF Transcript_18995/g.42281 Transcript_18995/m.42281 type:complete len:262 (-) Transcript_18995:218-1003(-)
MIILLYIFVHYKMQLSYSSTRNNYFSAAPVAPLPTSISSPLSASTSSPSSPSTSPSSPSPDAFPDSLTRSALLFRLVRVSSISSSSAFSSSSAGTFSSSSLLLCISAIALLTISSWACLILMISSSASMLQRDCSNWSWTEAIFLFRFDRLGSLLTTLARLSHSTLCSLIAFCCCRSSLRRMISPFARLIFSPILASKVSYSSLWRSKLWNVLSAFSNSSLYSRASRINASKTFSSCKFLPKDCNFMAHFVTEGRLIVLSL